ncbi:DNA-formamidopyrimidine glycosylase family protein, partial [Neisseria sp. P0014.S006]|uniref:DNA-formamidopyrimidine glycosylase family protein n=1 Tax=Neisseria sp. P0014.S006 TaxID=3436752 RepID=UPI003F7FF9CA
MPELTEVETTLRGLAPHIDGKNIEKVIIRQFKLRWPIHPDLAQILAGRKFLAYNRRAKYFIINIENVMLLIH